MLKRIADNFVTSHFLRVAFVWGFIFLFSVFVFLLHTFGSEIESFFALKDPMRMGIISLFVPIILSLLLLSVCIYVFSSIVKGSIKSYFGAINPILVALAIFLMGLAFHIQYSSSVFAKESTSDKKVAIR